MLSRMNQFRRVWRSNLSLKKKVDRYYALIVSKGVWGLHLLALKPADFAHLEYIHARCLRRILGLKAAFINHISNGDVLRKARTQGLEACIGRKQLALLGHILRREQEHPGRLICFQPHTDLQLPSFFAAVPGPYVTFTGSTTLLRTSLRVRPSKHRAA